MKIKFDINKCCGCKTCELVCSNKNYGICDINLSSIKIKTDIKTMIFKADYCRQCNNAECIKSCPVSAISKNDSGIITINREICLLCGKCEKICPFNGIHIIGKNILKCGLCEGEPQCVIHCPTNALTIN